MDEKKKIIFLVSGNGGNLKFIDLYLRLNHDIKYKIVKVISDRNCGAIDYAKKVNIDCNVIRYDLNHKQEMNSLLHDINADIIITNIHKILDKDIVNEYKGKLINLHYSILPSFKGIIGVRTIELGLDNKCKFFGSTTHFLNNEVDGGEIISQCVIPIDKSFNLSEITYSVFQSGCLNLLNTLFLINSNEKSANIDNNFSFVNIDRANILFSPKLLFEANEITDEVWDEIRSN